MAGGRRAGSSTNEGCGEITRGHVDRYRLNRCGSTTDHLLIDDPAQYEVAIVDDYLRLIAACPHLVATDKTPHLTSRFTSVAKRFSIRFGIEYQTWIAVGVPPGLLLTAGIEPDGP